MENKSWNKIIINKNNMLYYYNCYNSKTLERDEGKIESDKQIGTHVKKGDWECVFVEDSCKDTCCNCYVKITRQDYETMGNYCYACMSRINDKSRMRLKKKNKSNSSTQLLTKRTKKV